MIEQYKSQKKSWISFRVKPEEYDKIHALFRASAHRKLSEYARKVLLNKPVIIKYRNQSVDDFLSAMIPLKNELNAIGKNYNQSIKKLHLIHGFEDIKMWFVSNEEIIKILLKNIEQIKATINELYERWLQE